MKATNKNSKTEIQYIIVHEEMIWQFYYDQLGSKYFRELLGIEARKFLRSIASETEKDKSQKTSPRVSFNPE